MSGWRVLPFLLLSLTVSLWTPGASATGQAKGKAVKAHPLALKKVRQKDGSVVIRLDTRKAASGRKARSDPPGQPLRDSPSAIRNPLLSEQWLDAVTEPRIMTALASVATAPGMGTKEISQAVDPASVRNWAEFIDPDLYVRWKSSGLDPQLSPAIHHRGQDLWIGQRSIAFPIQLTIPPEFRPGAPLKQTIWTNAYSGGPGGHEATREWLKLPLPDARVNPWLVPGQNYRY